MKKLIFLAIVTALAGLAVQGQEIPERKTEAPKPVIKEKIFHKKERSNLNLTEEQKTKLKVMNQGMHKQMEDLKKQENITVKEYRDKMEALRKDHREKFESLLTAEQKEQMKKDKEAYKAEQKEFGAKKEARLKEKLKLTDEQAAKMAENRKATMEKMKAIRENKTLNEEQKKQEMKEVMKKQKEGMKSVLTGEQLQKLKENKKRSPKKKVVI